MEKGKTKRVEPTSHGVAAVIELLFNRIVFFNLILYFFVSISVSWCSFVCDLLFIYLFFFAIHSNRLNRIGSRGDVEYCRPSVDHFSCIVHFISIKLWTLEGVRSHFPREINSSMTLCTILTSKWICMYPFECFTFCLLDKIMYIVHVWRSIVLLCSVWC